MELKDSWSTSLPLRSVTFCLEQLLHHDLADLVAGLAPDVDHLVVALAGGDQARDVLLLDLLDLASRRASMRPCFSVGISMSSMAIEMPARVARRKPVCSSLSAKITVSFRPHLRKEALIRREISFFFSALLMLLEGQALGQDLRQQRATDRGARPGCVTGVNSPLSARA
jgi:hypothetical protein